MRPMPELEVVSVRTDDLLEYQNNAKEHPEEQVEQIARSIEEFGFNSPILAWHNDDEVAEIVAGHGRLMAARRLGIEELPVVFLDHMTEEQRRAYILVDNQLTMNSGFNLEMLETEIARIADIDMSAYGFEVEIPDERDLEPVEVDEDELPEVSPTRVSRGQIWQLGDHRLVCGDSTDPRVIDALMEGEEADLLLTDPPYNVDYVGKTKDALTIKNDDMEGDTYQRFMAEALKAAKPSIKEGGAFYVWYAAWRTVDLYRAMGDADLEIRQELYWVKSNITLGHQDYQWQTEPCLYGWKEGAHWFAPTRKEHNVIDDMAEIRKMDKAQLVEMVEALMFKGEETDAIRDNKPQRNADHPTMKPVTLFARLMRNSTRKGETVLDTFAGSGTTAIACEQMGRVARMAEIDEGYCDVILKRWERFTGKTARLVGTVGKE